MSNISSFSQVKVACNKYGKHGKGSKSKADLEHGCEVEHGDVGLAVVVDGEVEVRHLVVGREVGRVARVVKQRLL